MSTLLLMGSGGYTLSKESEELDLFFLSLIPTNKPRICLLPTASGDRQETISSFYDKFNEYGAIPSHISLFMPNVDDIESHLMRSDGIYITGGNTKSMLAVWYDWGLDKGLIKALDAGVPVAGISAGAMCFFEEGLSDSAASGYVKLNGLGVLRGSFCPHYQNSDRRAKYLSEIQTGQMRAGIGIGDGAGLYFHNGTLKKVVKPDNSTLCEQVSKGSILGL